MMQWLTLAISYPLTQNNLDHTFKQVIAIFGGEPVLRGAIAAFELIDAWRTKKYERAIKIANEHHEFLKIPLKPLTARMSIFFNFVVQLLKVKQKKEVLYLLNQEVKPLAVIGESHSLSSANLIFNLNETAYQANNHFIIGVKMHHLANFDSSHHASLVQSHLKQIEANIPLLFCIGEIDCRPDEGFWKVIQEKKIKPKEAIEITIDGYLHFLKKHIPNADGRTVFIQGIPAPGYRFASYRSQGNEEDFLAMLLQINNYLKVKTLEQGWHFLDVFSASGNRKWHVDANHISPAFYTEADQWLVLH